MQIIEGWLLAVKDWKSTEWAVVVACVAAAVALTTAFFSVLNTSRTIRAQIVSANRQKWIDAIRDDLAVFLRKSAVSHRQEWSSAPSTTIIADGEEARKEMHLLSLRIRLKLNPKEQPHILFMEMIEELRTTRRPEDDDLPDRLAQAGQEIFKSEWERIKRGR